MRKVIYVEGGGAVGLYHAPVVVSHLLRIQRNIGPCPTPKQSVLRSALASLGVLLSISYPRGIYSPLEGNTTATSTMAFSQDSRRVWGEEDESLSREGGAVTPTTAKCSATRLNWVGGEAMLKSQSSRVFVGRCVGKCLVCFVFGSGPLADLR